MKLKFRLPPKDLKILYALSFGPLNMYALASVLEPVEAYVFKHFTPIKERKEKGLCTSGDFRKLEKFHADVLDDLWGLSKNDKAKRVFRRVKALYRDEYIKKIRISGPRKLPLLWDTHLMLTEQGALQLETYVHMPKNVPIVHPYFEAYDTLTTLMIMQLHEQSIAQRYELLSLLDAYAQSKDAGRGGRNEYGVPHYLKNRTSLIIKVKFSGFCEPVSIAFHIEGYDDSVTDNFFRAKRNYPAIILCRNIEQLEIHRAAFTRGIEPDLKVFLTTQSEFQANGLMGAIYFCYPQFKTGKLSEKRLLNLMPLVHS